MNAIQIAFQVRIQDRMDLGTMQERVEKALGLKMQKTNSRMLSYGEGVEATTIGMLITLSYPHNIPDGEERTYVLMGKSSDELYQYLTSSSDYLDISSNILTILHIHDSKEWYIPELKELLEEAGISQ
jgi:hypothetical protein